MVPEKPKPRSPLSMCPFLKTHFQDKTWACMYVDIERARFNQQLLQSFCFIFQSFIWRQELHLD